MKKISFGLLLLLFVGITAGNSGGRKKVVVTMPLRAPGMKCDWSKAFPVDMMCELDVPADATRVDALMMLRPAVWTEEEWKEMLTHELRDCDEAKNPGSCSSQFHQWGNDNSLHSNQH